ncbi:ROK family glucokinase [Bifidobacterium sp. MA2]|uniref:Glucokinase n=1 Tax=Bifidobacterium santillanense TaxID=2809028 RepID=A0ABS5UR63_9BIFI|nr:ROK family glucokinase [Bifidobacterium santillanense]MBT1173481.1 ROK family glucokinase [Bifidobacterium santillanense]
MHVLALDIGGTKIAAAVLDDDNVILRKWRVPSSQDPADIDRIIARMYRRAAEEFADIEAIGLSVCGNVPLGRRSIEFAPNIAAWTNYPLSDNVEALIGGACPVVVENDANCAGWGEYVKGAGRGSRNMVLLTVGTGLGGAIIINGELYRGSFGMAGEIGHTPMVPDGDTCGCGLRGCTERYISGNALERFTRSAVRRWPDKSGLLMELCDGDLTKLTGERIAQALEQGDELAHYGFGKIGEWLGRAMAATTAVLDPDLYVIGGGVVAVGDALLEPARYNYRRFLEAGAYRGLARIVPAEAGQDAGLIGAADLARR